MVEVNVEALRNAVNAILEHIQFDLGVATVRLEEDFYWNVDSNELFRSGEKPSLLDLGSLHDDWDFLKEAAVDKEQAVALLLTHAAPLLRYIGEKIGQ